MDGYYKRVAVPERGKKLVVGHYKKVTVPKRVKNQN